MFLKYSVVFLRHFGAISIPAPLGFFTVGKSQETRAGIEVDSGVLCSDSGLFPGIPGHSIAIPSDSESFRSVGIPRVIPGHSFRVIPCHPFKHALTWIANVL